MHLVGSFIMVLMSSVVAIPVGMLAGIYLSENPHTKLAYYSGLCVDILQGVPSIVVGIVVYFWIVKPLGTFSAISGSVALAIMMLPIVIRSTEQTLTLIARLIKRSGAFIRRTLSPGNFKSYCSLRFCGYIIGYHAFHSAYYWRNSAVAVYRLW